MAIVPSQASPPTDDLIAEVLPGIHDAANPYFDFICGGPDAARATLNRWARRESSEVSIRRVVMIQNDGNAVGGFIAMDGLELQKARRLDMAALTMGGNSRDREAMVKRLHLVQDLFMPPEPQDYYLSKLWIDRPFRGCGYSKHLMQCYLQCGHRLGFSQFRLDVCAGNERAIHLYRTLGFIEGREGNAPEAGLRYLTMTARFPS